MSELDDRVIWIIDLLKMTKEIDFDLD